MFDFGGGLWAVFICAFRFRLANAHHASICSLRVRAVAIGRDCCLDAGAAGVSAKYLPPKRRD